jgi:hypothetical protein
MVPIGGKPLLEHTIEWLRGFGVTEIVINLSYLPDFIRSHLGDGERWGVRITYSLEAEPLGTAGGGKRAAGFFDGPFFLWYGDNLSTCNLAAFTRPTGPGAVARPWPCTGAATRPGAASWAGTRDGATGMRDRRGRGRGSRDRSRP